MPTRSDFKKNILSEKKRDGQFLPKILTDNEQFLSLRKTVLSTRCLEPFSNSLFKKKKKFRAANTCLKKKGRSSRPHVKALGDEYATCKYDLKDARADKETNRYPRISAAASARESGRRCFFLCRGPHLARDCPDRNNPSGKELKKTNRSASRSAGT